MLATLLQQRAAVAARTDAETASAAMQGAMGQLEAAALLAWEDEQKEEVQAALAEARRISQQLA